MKSMTPILSEPFKDLFMFEWIHTRCAIPMKKKHQPKLYILASKATKHYQLSIPLKLLNQNLKKKYLFLPNVNVCSVFLTLKTVRFPIQIQL